MLTLSMYAFRGKADIVIRRRRTIVRCPRGYPRDVREFEDTARHVVWNQSFASDSLMFDQCVAFGSIDWDGV